MFCDQTKVTLQAGKGGDGLIAFFRTKGVAKGGPEGGDGGRGGDIILRASKHLNSLVDLHTRKLFKAPKGEPGGPNNRHGASADDMIIEVPMGTHITNVETGEVMADLTQDGDELVAAVGGRGGYGNAHFTTSVRQAPRFAELGEPGEEVEIALELKLVADVGVIGLPSAGKSTFLSVVSDAQPKIGDYPFTTLVPNLGVVRIDQGRSIVMCDIPGLIEGAADGKGLGHEFLRHVSRNRCLIHLVDINSQDHAQDYQTIRKELAKYNPELCTKPEIICFSKGDLMQGDEHFVEEVVQEFCSETKKNRKDIIVLSSLAKIGVKDLLEKVWQTLRELKKLDPPVAERERVIYRPHLKKNPKAWQVTMEDENIWKVSGIRIEQIAIMSDMTNPEAVQRIRDVLRKMGIENELLKQGAKHGDQLLIGRRELLFEPNLLKN